MSAPLARTVHGRWIDDPEAGTLVDAHHHVWDLGRNDCPWLSHTPEPHFFLGDYDGIKRDDPPDDYRRDAARHSQPDVHLKVSEFGLRDQPRDYESNRRIVLEAIAIFGIERCMFASNFPVAGLRVGYDTLVRSVRRMLDGFSDADRHRFFVGNAAAFHRLDLGAAARAG